ncbi:hypothetical protein DNU06_17495 [Putridiphycobacter roseus]|uniref:Uncharacterized protein n=1 Tax=Putridiphycobacter roseus TaxID=2219161 RepID=A0A2W1NIV1_9FLAO|nr:hypothetical protein [Putridiphycobacter roseus]PZE15552.1 hypothetical protein DNU06_17495 [Putridiphycobacter roseus]
MLTTFLVFSCNKKYGKIDGKEYSKGIIYFEIDNEVPLSESKNVMESIGKEKFKLNGFKYTTQTTFDSLTFFAIMFDSIEYLDVFDIVYDKNSKEATFRNMGFENLSSTNLITWNTLLDTNGIIESQNSEKYGYLYIDEGTEQYWIDILKEKGEISDADFVWKYSTHQ